MRRNANNHHFVRHRSSYGCSNHVQPYEGEEEVTDITGYLPDKDDVTTDWVKAHDLPLADPVTEQRTMAPWSSAPPTWEQLQEELKLAYAAEVRLSNRNAQLVSTIDVLLWSLARLHQAYQELKGNA
jgi:hypothetical protein